MLDKLFGGKGGPDGAALLKMFLPLLTDKNIQKAIGAFHGFVQSKQTDAGGKMVLSAEESDDGKQLNLRIWKRGENNSMTLYKEIDLYTVTQSQIKSFVNGI